MNIFKRNTIAKAKHQVAKDFSRTYLHNEWEITPQTFIAAKRLVPGANLNPDVVQIFLCGFENTILDVVTMIDEWSYAESQVRLEQAAFDRKVKAYAKVSGLPLAEAREELS